MNAELTLEQRSDILLSHVNTPKGKSYSAFEGGIGQALGALWERMYATDNLEIDARVFGLPPANPKASVIVPLYGRIDLVMYQMSIFTNDPDFLKHAELIYVLDDPRQYTAVRRYVESLYPLYRVPFKLIRYDANLGYAKANNIGSRYADANLLILMNSDVMPKRSNWVSRCVDRFNQLDNAGVAGIQLIFEDNTIQHRGMRFERSPLMDDLWVNVHLGKGMTVIDKETDAVAVPAVTGALMITPKTIFQEVSGLSEDYILGDFEDSDYCLKLYEKGYSTYYLPDIEMYHLERQSQSASDKLNKKKKITLYNCWKHSHRWNDTIEKVMKEFCDEV
jgi:GT2 family glycosyltransferase